MAPFKSCLTLGIWPGNLSKRQMHEWPHAQQWCVIPLEAHDTRSRGRLKPRLVQTSTPLLINHLPYEPQKPILGNQRANRSIAFQNLPHLILETFQDPAWLQFGTRIRLSVINLAHIAARTNSYSWPTLRAICEKPQNWGTNSQHGSDLPLKI